MNTKILCLYSFCELLCTFYLKKIVPLTEKNLTKVFALLDLLWVCGSYKAPNSIIPSFSSSLGLDYYSEICKRLQLCLTRELSHHDFSLFKYEENVQKCTPYFFAANPFLDKLLGLKSRHNSSCISSQGIPGHEVPACWTLKIYCFALKGNV